ncbi:MAG: immunoglobulin-like domain-containing protein, partial [Sphaerospermopsis kisseleviana]
TTLYLRLAATAGVSGSYNGQTITVSGGGAASVTATTAASGNTISAKALTVTGLSATDKAYDGTTEVVVVGTPAYDGLVNNESFPVSGSVAWAFADKNIGAGKVLARTGSFTAPSANYTIATQPSLTASITGKPLTVGGATVTTKIYDGTTAATITGATLVGVVAGDSVAVSGGGNFNNANAGENKPVTASLSLGGAGAGNYTLTQPSLTGTITKADQTITFAELPGKNLGDAPFSLTGTASSGLSVSYTSSNPGVASVSGSTVTILSVGSTTITAGQTGNSNYNAATPVARTLTVTDAPVLIAGWDFQTTTNGGTAAATTDAPLLYQANFGAGSLHLDGANGSSAWIVSTNTTNNQVTGFSGTTVNAAAGFSTNTASPAALALQGGASNSANGNSLVFKVDMTGRKDLTVSYATRGSQSGFTTHTWSVSTNASNWTEVSVQTGRTNTTFTTITLPVITNANSASNVFLRLTVAGATNPTGNNRLDNVQFMATAVAASDTAAPVITVLGDNPLTLPVGATFNDPGATALDAVDGVVTVNTSGSVNNAVPGVYTITYSATDAANNTATAARTVNVVDVTAPIITVAGDNPLYLPVGATYVEPGVSAVDAIDRTVAVQTSGSVNTAARGTYTLTYSATDAADNTSTASRTVVVRSGAAHVLATQFGLSGAMAGLTVDADNDRVNNLVEYARGTDPTSPADFPSPPSIRFVDGKPRVSAIVRDDIELSIVAKGTTNLASDWSASGIVEVVETDQQGVSPGHRRRTWEAPAASTMFIRFDLSYD